mmetsp:Transcript_9734/g.18278  ORF Transcript_9734/g.18278 Transcript_9734/m.18278 type:complete len:124 (+) Transcript_9734:1602-1973(+)
MIRNPCPKHLAMHGCASGVIHAPILVLPREPNFVCIILNSFHYKNHFLSLCAQGFVRFIQVIYLHWLFHPILGLLEHNVIRRLAWGWDEVECIFSGLRADSVTNYKDERKLSKKEKFLLFKSS